MVEFDDRIFRVNETRAGSITLQLQETIRAIKRYPDAWQQVHLGMSNAEARLGAVQQNATHRIEVIRTASTVQSQASCQDLDEILRRAKHRVDSEYVGKDRRDHDNLSSTET